MQHLECAYVTGHSVYVPFWLKAARGCSWTILVLPDRVFLNPEKGTMHISARAGMGADLSATARAFFRACNRVSEAKSEPTASLQFCSGTTTASRCRQPAEHSGAEQCRLHACSRSNACPSAPPRARYILRVPANTSRAPSTGRNSDCAST